ncbi:MAG: glycosyltransferase family 4 protein [Bacteroidales bacterium]|nr:glycosyltransferase family 4 protein [Bacteroidales bacterium]
MNICHFIWNAKTGGIQRFIEYLGQEQLKENQVTLFLGCITGDFLENFINSGISVVDTGIKRGLNLNPFLLHKLVKKFNHFDIIHFHSFNYLGFFAALISRSRIVYTFHGTSYGRRRIELSDRLIYLTINLFSARINAVTANSKFTLEQNSKYIKAIRRAKVIYNPIRIDELIKKISLPKEATIISFSRLVKSKRLDIFLNVILGLLKRNIDVKAKIIGDGPEKHSLIQLTNNLKINGNVEFIPFKRNLNPIIDNCTLAIFPSMNEPFGIVALECLVRGKLPVVFKHGGGLVEVMQEIQDGMFIANSTEHAIEIIEKLITKQDVLESLFKSLVKRALDFDVKSVCNSFSEVYHSTLI